MSQVFTAEEESQILHYLGYPKEQTAIAGGSLGYRMNNTSLDYLRTSFHRVSVEGASRVREQLAELRCIDQALSALRSKAHVVRTGDIELDATKGRRLLLAERRRYVQMLSEDLAAPINPWAGGGPRVSNT